MDDIHKKTIELLPWYVNGTLPVHEHAELERHVNQCLSCRIALREEQRLQKLVGEEDEVPRSSRHGIADLMEKIDGPRDVRHPPSMARPRPAYILAMVGIVCGIVLLLIVPQFPSSVPEQGGFSTLTNAQRSAERQIDIIFASGTDAADIDQVVAGIGGQIVNGPSAIGRYSVRLPDDAGMSVERVIDGLAADPRVEFVSQSFGAVATGEIQ